MIIAKNVHKTQLLQFSFVLAIHHACQRLAKHSMDTNSRQDSVAKAQTNVLPLLALVPAPDLLPNWVTIALVLTICVN